MAPVTGSGNHEAGEGHPREGRPREGHPCEATTNTTAGEHLRTKATTAPSTPASRRSSSGGSRKATTSVASGSDAAAGPTHAKVPVDPATAEGPSE